jgi:murein DD-endopeptidase MepM/ murein hydrolase activator NlpD
MAKRYINFLIVPEGNPRSLKFKLSFFVTRVIVSVLGFLLVFIVVLSILHGKLLYEVIAGKSLKQENERLKRYNAKVVELKKELGEYKRFVQRVAQLAGVEYPKQSEVQLAYYHESIDPGDEEVVLSFPEKEEEKISSPDSISTQPDSLGHIPMGEPIEGWITRGFSIEIYGFGGEHPGVDFAAKIGTEVKATAKGKVVLASWDDIYGNLVGIDHQNGYVTYYGHNSKILVNVGDTIRQGEVIALSGNTGRSSAPHLHYEIRKNDVPIDPESFLRQR